MSRQENVDASTGRGSQRSESATAGTGARSADQEQRLPTSRESARGGRALARQQQQQPSLISSVFATPPGLLAGAFMSNPFAFMRRMTEEMNQIFESANAGTAMDRSGNAGLAAAATWVPQVEVRRRDNELVVRADLPGLGNEDVNVDIEDGMLVLSGERQQEERDEGEGYVRSERSYGRFYRAIPLPEGVDENNITASFDNGVLEIHVPLPQQQQRRGRRLEIGSGQGQSRSSSGRSASGRTESGSESRAQART